MNINIFSMLIENGLMPAVMILFCHWLTKRSDRYYEDTRKDYLAREARMQTAIDLLVIDKAETNALIKQIDVRLQVIESRI